MKPIIQIDDVGKLYRIGANKGLSLSLREEVASFFSMQSRRARAAQREFWALRNVSFEVNEGEVVGVIGRNGAGKSTLLKILSRTTPPTEGEITMRGRAASLLEVGTGFHPELSGRENIYLNGSILGMSRKEIGGKFDEIVQFAEVERFLDTPVKRYSSGMYVRLAFAIAAHLDPEILIVDEVLSVGDAVFQSRCLGKMDEVAKSGRTVLFVSHNLSAVTQLCARGVVLVSGRVAYIGDAQDAVANYTQTNVSHEGEIDLDSRDAVAGRQLAAKFTEARLTGSDGTVQTVFRIGDTMTLQMEVTFSKPVRSARLSFVVRSTSGVKVYHCVMQDSGLKATDVSGRTLFSATFPQLSLYPGTYVIDDLWLADSEETLDHVSDVMTFSVVEGGPAVRRQLGKNMALVHTVPEWTLQKNGGSRSVCRRASGNMLRAG